MKGDFMSNKKINFDNKVDQKLIEYDDNLQIQDFNDDTKSKSMDLIKTNKLYKKGQLIGQDLKPKNKEGNNTTEEAQKKVLDKLGQKSHKHKLTSKINNNKIEEFDHKSPNEIMEDIDTLSDMAEDDFEDNQDDLGNDHDHYHSSYEEANESHEIETEKNRKSKKNNQSVLSCFVVHRFLSQHVQRLTVQTNNTSTNNITCISICQRVFVSAFTHIIFSTVNYNTSAND